MKQIVFRDSSPVFYLRNSQIAFEFDIEMYWCDLCYSFFRRLDATQVSLSVEFSYAEHDVNIVRWRHDRVWETSPAQFIQSEATIEAVEQAEEKEFDSD